jgi:tRNA dimethylallyltransferase
MPEKRVILIAGPTASGKSATALALAEIIGAEIVNADAIQVYRDLTILSARPTPAETARAPHHLFGVVDAAVRYSAGEWSRDAAKALADIAARGRPAIVVGGTGFYFRALEQGLSAAPDIPEDIRNASRARFDAIGADAFRAEVLAFDPAMSRLDPADRQRHVRAWEVFHAAGVPLTKLQDAPGTPLVGHVDARIVIEPPRAALYSAIGTRFDDMMAAGALDEVRELALRGLASDLPAMKALGVVELLAHIAGRLSRTEAVDLAKRNSRRFAKRQLTWFRNQTPGWPRTADPEEAARRLAAAFATTAPRG